MKRYVVALVIILSLLTIYRFYANNKKAPPVVEMPTPTFGTADEQELWGLIQEFRSEKDKPQYTKSDFLCSIASTRVAEIKTDYSHEQFKYYRWCDDCHLGENIVRGRTTAQATLKAWVESPKHYELLMLDFTHACVRTEEDRAVIIFGYR